MTLDKLNELEQLAKRATPGPWQYDDGLCEIAAFIPTKGEECVLMETTAGFATQKDYAYIAAANPQAILELISALRKAVETLEFYASRERSDLRDSYHYGAIARACLNGLGVK